MLGASVPVCQCAEPFEGIIIHIYIWKMPKSLFKKSLKFHTFIHHLILILNPNPIVIFSGPVCRAIKTKWFWNHCLINLSNLIQFSHIYTPLYFQSKSNGTIYIVIGWCLTMLFQKQWWLLPSLSSTKNKSNAPWKFSIRCHRYLNCNIYFLYTHFEGLYIEKMFCDWRISLGIINKGISDFVQQIMC